MGMCSRCSTAVDDKLVVFGSGDEVALDFDPAKLPALPTGWVRDYFFVANGYEKDMDFYAYRGDTVDPLPFREMRAYPYPGQSFPTIRNTWITCWNTTRDLCRGRRLGGIRFGIRSSLEPSAISHQLTPNQCGSVRRLMGG